MSYPYNTNNLYTTTSIVGANSFPTSGTLTIGGNNEPITYTSSTSSTGVITFNLTIPVPPVKYITATYNINDDWAIDKSSNWHDRGTYIDDDLYHYTYTKGWFNKRPIKVGDIVKTPIGKGLVYNIEEDIYCVELDPTSNILHEFNIDEIEQDG